MSFATLPPTFEHGLITFPNFASQLWFIPSTNCAYTTPFALSAPTLRRTLDPEMLSYFRTAPAVAEKEAVVEKTTRAIFVPPNAASGLPAMDKEQLQMVRLRLKLSNGRTEGRAQFKDRS